MISSHHYYRNLPKYFSSQKYDAAIQEYVNLVSHGKDLVAIYQIGDVHVEGISDIDLIVVLRDECEIKNGKRFFVNNLNNKNFNYLFGHDPFFCQESLFPQLNKIFYYKKIQHLYGRNFLFESLSSIDIHFRNLLILQENIICLLAAFLRIYNSVVVDLRDLFQIFFSFNYCIELAEEILLIKKESLENCSQKINYIRSSWLNFEQKKKLLCEAEELLQTIIFYSIELCESLGAYLNEMVRVEIHRSKIQIMLPYNIILLFTETNKYGIRQYNYDPLLIKLYTLPIIFKKIKIILKKTFLPYFLCLSQNTKCIGPRYLSQFFLPAQGTHCSFLNKDYEKSIQRRIEALDSQINFIINNNIQYGWFVNYFYFRLN